MTLGAITTSNLKDSHKKQIDKIEEINEQEIEDYIKFAGVCGLLTCLGEGAIEQQPYYEKVNKFLGSLIS